MTNIYTIALALTAALAIGLMSGFALMRRMSLAGDVMSHIALPGLGLAILWNLNPVVGAAAALALGAVFIWGIGRATSLPNEATIGIVFSASLAVGALITPSEDLIEALFGGNAPITPLTFAAYLVLSAGVISFLWLYRSRLVLRVFNADLAKVTGVRVEWLDLLFLFAFAATLVLGLRFLGALLVGTLVIIPGAIARQLTQTLSAFLAVSMIASILSVGIGMTLSNAFQLEIGPVVVLTASAAFFVSMLFRRTA
jgi:zinc transport system permease protein